MARTKPPAQRRADILAAARELFVSKGMGATTVEDITKGAEISQGLFYRYFRSKDELIFALQEDYAVRFAQRLVDAAAQTADWAGKLDASVEASFASFRESHDLHEVLFRHSGSREAEPAHAPLAEALRRLLEAGVAAGAYAVTDPAATAVLLNAATHAFDPSFNGSHPPTDPELIAAAQQLFRRAAGVTSPPASRRRRPPQSDQTAG